MARTKASRTSRRERPRAGSRPGPSRTGCIRRRTQTPGEPFGPPSPCRRRGRRGPSLFFWGGGLVDLDGTAHKQTSSVVARTGPLTPTTPPPLPSFEGGRGGRRARPAHIIAFRRPVLLGRRRRRTGASRVGAVGGHHHSHSSSSSPAPPAPPPLLDPPLPLRPPSVLRAGREVAPPPPSSLPCAPPALRTPCRRMF